MLDNEFKNTQDFLRSKMPDYLRSRGINPSAKFACLNPEHRDHLPSMSYNPQDYTVHCFSCNKTYDIFDLIGIDYNLSDYKSQFIRAYELFTSTQAPYSLLQQLDLYVSTSNEETPQNPQFEIATGYNDFPTFTFEPTPETPPAVDQSAIAHNVSQFQNIPVAPAPITPRDLNFNRSQGLVFGANSFQNYNLPTQQNGLNKQSGLFTTPVAEPTHYNFSEYVKQCVNNVDKTDYFTYRGISPEVVKKFRLGFDERFIAGIDQLGEQQIWQAIILPFGDNAYMARNTDHMSKDRFRKKGPFDIFNKEALGVSGPIFITEGEFDALSFETLGYPAISLGGASNIRGLLELVKQINVDHTFYICLDNDEVGQEAAKQLALGLYQLKIPYKRINVSFPYKDPNEALVKDRQGLKDRLENLDELLSFNLSSLTPLAVKYKFITTAEDLFKLNVSPSLYTLCSAPQTLRCLVADMANNKQCAFVYAGSLNQWQYLGSFIKRPENHALLPNSADLSNIRFLEINQEKLCEEIEKGIISCKVQGEPSFTTIVDISSCTPEEAVKMTAKLGKISALLNTCIIALCNSNASTYVEAQALQTINIAQNNNRDFICKTIDENGKSIDFTKYTGI